MPLDGTNVLDETGLVILKAKEALKRDGWCTDIRRDDRGRRCALGAIDAALGLEDGKDLADSGHPVVERLASVIPLGPYAEVFGSGHTVAYFNNAQTEPQVIYDWFDRAAYSSL